MGQKETNSSINLAEIFKKNPFLETLPIWVVSDIDDVLYGAAEKHEEELKAIAIDLNWPNPPSTDDFFKNGGSHKSYGHIKDYWEINDGMVNSLEFNKDLKLIEGSVEALNFLAPYLLMYLTTRPDSIASLSEEENLKNHYPDRPIISRPENVSIKDTTEWKLRVLTELAKEKNVLMIDDSASLYDAIMDLKNPKITAILFKGSITPDRENAKNWKEIIELPCWESTMDAYNFVPSYQSVE